MLLCATQHIFSCSIACNCSIALMCSQHEKSTQSVDSHIPSEKMMFFVQTDIAQEKYWVSVSVLVSDFKGLGRGRGGLVLNGQVLVSVSVSVSNDEVLVSVSDNEAETPSLVAAYLPQVLLNCIMKLHDCINKLKILKFPNHSTQINICDLKKHTH